MKKTLSLFFAVSILMGFIVGCDSSSVQSEEQASNELLVSKVNDTNYIFAKGKKEGNVTYSPSTIELKVGSDFKVIMKSIDKSVRVLAKSKQGVFLQVNPEDDKVLQANIVLLSDVINKIEEINSEVFTQYDVFYSSSRNLRPTGINKYEFCSGFGGNKATASDRAETGDCAEEGKKNCTQVGGTDCGCAWGDFVCYCTTTWRCP